MLTVSENSRGLFICSNHTFYSILLMLYSALIRAMIVFDFDGSINYQSLQECSFYYYVGPIRFRTITVCIYIYIYIQTIICTIYPMHSKMLLATEDFYILAAVCIKQ